MGEPLENATKNRQESSGIPCDLFPERSQPEGPELKNGCDPIQQQEIQGEYALQDVPIFSESVDQRSQPGEPVLGSKGAAALLGISMQAVRDNAAAGKYPGAQKIPGNGGEGWAIPLSSLPPTAQALYWHQHGVNRGQNGDLFEEVSTLPRDERDALWAKYDKATPKCQERGRNAMAALLHFDRLLRQGVGKMEAYKAIKAEFGAVRSTFNLWQQTVEGLAQCDWLPALVPDFSGRTNALRAEWPGESWVFFLKHATTPCRSVKAAYRSTVREAAAQGWGKLPSLRTAHRDFDAMDDTVKTLLREGPTALKRLSPTGERDYSFYALHEQWSMDGRRLDLMVRDTEGEFGPRGRVFRLWFYAVMEMRSRYLVGYSLGPELNSDAVRSALVNAITKTGRIIPTRVQVDNGMEAAAKEITGGAPWRLRGKVKEDEIIGLLPMLGIEVSWATPAHGQTKPIERLFKTLAEVETLPDFAGAYCGNKPSSRPEEWDASKAVPIDLVRQKYPEQIATYHHSPHRGDGMDGKTPFQVYEEHMTAPGFVPRKLVESQFRACLMSAVAVTLRKDGTFAIHGARYWSEQTASLSKGSGYYARYNPHDLAAPVYLYRGHKIVAEGVKQIERIPGNSKEHARKIAKARREFIRNTKNKAKSLFDLQALETPMEIARIAAQKHPEIIDKATGEILPVAQVIAMTQTAAEVPREPSQAEAAEAQKIRATADEISEFLARQGRQKAGGR